MVKIPMVKILVTVVTTMFTAVNFAYAGVSISPRELPQPVNRTINEYFPDAKILRAERDMDEGKTKFEVKVRYKDINLKLNVNPQGRILDVDMVR